jgi:hypothetical protein
MTYELEGSIKLIGDTASYGAKGFTKRELVVTTSAERFPQDIKFEFVKEKTELLDKFRVGQQVKVAFDIRGSEYNGKYYVSLTGWKIDNSDGSGESAPPRQQGGQVPRGGGGGGGRSQAPAGNNKGFTEEDFNQSSKDEEYPF